MLKAVLFDLDDTLLGNPMDQFMPAYFLALTRFLDGVIAAERLIGDLMRATRAMNAKHSPELTNEEVFASVFYPLLGKDSSRVRAGLEQFYEQEFPNLRHMARRRPEARKLVRSALEHGLQVAVATNPMFPRVAVEERLAWAGVPVEDFDYALVTTLENMHATKAHLLYYQEILEKLGRRPGGCLMVGDSWSLDIDPAAALGLRAFWITEADKLPAQHASLVGWGTLTDLWANVQAEGWAL
jgi:FMN phosphatase YigB (HAD superfamily)